MKMSVEHFAVNRRGSTAKLHARPALQPLAGVDERLPDFRPALVSHSSHQETLHAAAARQPSSEKARRKHASVIDDEHIAG